MTKLKITISDLNYINKVVGGFSELTLDQIKLAFSMEKDFVLTEDDIKKSGFEQDGTNIKWKDAKFRKTVELADDKMKLLKLGLKKQIDKAVKDKLPYNELKYLMEVDAIINKK